MHMCVKNILKINPNFSWETIGTVMLDMDGTLLDKHFDDYFWEVYLPEHYSLLHDISVEQAAADLSERYRKVENSLQWADLEYWSHELNLDIPELKLRIDHLIAVHPHAAEFLEFCSSMGKQLYLVTNAHPRTLSIKLNKADISTWFDRVICAEEAGFAKEDPKFWPRLREMLHFDPARSLLADDTEKVLQAADAYGLACLIHIARPGSRRQIRYSERYPSIEYFQELMDLPLHKK
jgi:HAD superfamily hydrolase (TIGR01509 family)